MKRASSASFDNNSCPDGVRLECHGRTSAAAARDHSQLAEVTGRETDECREPNALENKVKTVGWTIAIPAPHRQKLSAGTDRRPLDIPRLLRVGQA